MMSTSCVIRASVTYALTAWEPNSTVSFRPRKKSNTASWIVANGSGSRMAKSWNVNAPSPNIRLIPMVYFAFIHFHGNRTTIDFYDYGDFLLPNRSFQDLPVDSLIASFDDLDQVSWNEPSRRLVYHYYF